MKCLVVAFALQATRRALFLASTSQQQGLISRIVGIFRRHTATDRLDLLPSERKRRGFRDCSPLHLCLLSRHHHRCVPCRSLMGRWGGRCGGAHPRRYSFPHLILTVVIPRPGFIMRLCYAASLRRRRTRALPRRRKLRRPSPTPPLLSFLSNLGRLTPNPPRPRRPPHRRQRWSENPSRVPPTRRRRRRRHPVPRPQRQLPPPPPPSR